MVKIGTQIWMAENLCCNIDKWCWAYGNIERNVPAYGYLYSWQSAIAACPPGWHVPSDSEWNTLCTYLGGKEIAGGRLKETGNAHRTDSNSGASNDCGFSGLPGGVLKQTSGDLSFKLLTKIGAWWSSSEKSDKVASGWVVSSELSGIISAEFWKRYGLSVRCVSDTTDISCYQREKPIKKPVGGTGK